MRGSASMARAKQTSWRWPSEEAGARSPTLVAKPADIRGDHVHARSSLRTAASMTSSSGETSELAQANVVHDGAGEEEIGLGDDAHLFSCNECGVDFADVDAVDRATRRRWGDRIW